MNKNLDRIVNHIWENKNFLPFNIEFKTFKDFYIAFEQKENNNSEFNFPNGLISYNDIEDSYTIKEGDLNLDFNLPHLKSLYSKNYLDFLKKLESKITSNIRTFEDTLSVNPFNWMNSKFFNTFYLSPRHLPEYYELSFSISLKKINGMIEINSNCFKNFLNEPIISVNFNKDFFNFSINEIPEDFFVLLTLDSQTLSNINLKEKRTKVDLKNIIELNNIIVYC